MVDVDENLWCYICGTTDFRNITQPSQLSFFESLTVSQREIVVLG